MINRFVNPVIKYTTDTLQTMPGAELYFYVTGTTTPKDTYQDINGTTPHSHPIVALSDGHFPPIFLDGFYSSELKYNGITQPGWPVDNIGATSIPTPLDDWEPTVTYSIGQLVTASDGNRYESLIDGNLNNEPSAAPAAWLQIFLGVDADIWQQLDTIAHSGSGAKTDAQSAIRYAIDLPTPTDFGAVTTNPDGTYTNRTFVDFKTDLSLNNVDNTSDANKPVSDVQAATLAPIDSPIFTGNPTAPTPLPDDNNTNIATTEFVQNRNRSFLDGTEALPSIAFTSDPETGIYRKAPDSIAISVTGNDRLVITSEGRTGVGTNSPYAKIHAFVQNDVTCGVRSSCYWTGSTETPYQNNDCSLFEVFNDVQSDSLNLSWAVSAANAYNNIPEGVTDVGNRVGVYGWAVSTPIESYIHAGTLKFQFGLWGRAGFLGPGSPVTGTINNAIGVRGDIVNDSSGATIVNAVAGEFSATAATGQVKYAYAVRAVAVNGTVENWSFHGDAGQMFNQDKVFIKSKFSDMNSSLCSRGVGNTFEFGFPSGGYGSSVGVMPSRGNPFIAFCAKVDSTTDTFTTSGKAGHVIYNNLDGALIFGRATNALASGQALSEVFRADKNGRVQFQSTPIIPKFTPASATATGQTGQVSWDDNYVYVCVGTNQWKRTSLSSW